MTQTGPRELGLVFFGAAGSVQSVSQGNTSFLVRSGQASVLVDASGSPHQNLLRAGSSCTELDAVLLTHAHTDHIYALPSLLHQAWLSKRKRPLTIIGLPETLQVARRLGDALGLWDRSWSFELHWQETQEGRALELAGLALDLFRVDHAGHPTVGAAFATAQRKLVYSCDSGPCNAVLERARGADWLIHEAGNGVANAEAGGQPTDVFSFSLPHPPSVNGHSTCQEAAIVAAEAGVERLFLCHLDFGKYTEEELRRAAERNFPGEVTVPQAFKEYLLP